MSYKDIKNKSVENNKYISHVEITDAIEELENVNAYFYSIEALMERFWISKLQKMWKLNLIKF